MAKLTIATMDGPVAPTPDAAGLAAYIRKGDIIEVYHSTYLWGRKETLPTIIRAEITDRTKEQVDDYLQNVKKAFDYTLDNQNAQGVRATVSVDQSLSGQIDLEVRQELKDYILAGGSLGLSVSLHAQTANSLTVNIALPNDATRTPTLLAFRDDINDKFAEQIGYRRYHFESSAVDSVVASGGTWSGTAAQAAANIVDRFA